MGSESLRALETDDLGKIGEFHKEAERLGFSNPQNHTSLDRIAFLPLGLLDADIIPFGKRVSEDEFNEIIEVHPHPSFWVNGTHYKKDQAVV